MNSNFITVPVTKIFSSFTQNLQIEYEHMASGLSLTLVLAICLPESVRGLVPGSERSMK
jgi:low temperature requirement protein LtrA